MREIKFRAWSIEKQAWVYFGLDNVPSWVHPAEAEQYTGLCDKNGKEIYEGDILQYGSRPDNRHPVEYRPEMASYTGISTDNGAYLWISKAVVENCEVVGNIYENPDLLEVKEDAQ